MSYNILLPDRVYLPDGSIQHKAVVIEQDNIVDICDPIHLPDGNLIRLAGYQLAPGFIDVHIHGYHGADVMDATPQALKTIASTLTQNGVVAWVGTTVSADMDSTFNALANVRDFIKDQSHTDAQLLGSFLEGPYLNPLFRGAHPTAVLHPATISELEQIYAITGDTLLRVAVAPELEGATEVIEWLRKKGIKPCIAHSNANFDEMTKAYHAGADCGVHLFNGMRGLQHREPGCVGSLLFYPMWVELIADGVHVHPAMMTLAWRLTGQDRLMLITDCMRAGGLSDGEYLLGDIPVTVKDHIARTHDGSLAGSTSRLDHSVRQAVKCMNISAADAIKLVTGHPARYLGIEDTLGFIKPRATASFTLLDDQLTVHGTMVNGHWAYQSKQLQKNRHQ